MNSSNVRSLRFFFFFQLLNWYLSRRWFHIVAVNLSFFFFFLNKSVYCSSLCFYANIKWEIFFLNQFTARQIMWFDFTYSLMSIELKIDFKSFYAFRSLKFYNFFFYFKFSISIKLKAISIVNLYADNDNWILCVISAKMNDN